MEAQGPMAFDPLQEDVMRAVLSELRRKGIPLDSGLRIRSLIASYQDDPSRLIRTDPDRAFHLVAEASMAVDYQAPFVESDEKADELTSHAQDLLAEAARLDPSNWDAVRMAESLRSPSNEEYVRWLVDGEQAVRESWEAERARGDEGDPYRAEYLSDLAGRPYVRWLAALSSRAVIAGHYRMALDACERALAFDPSDPADVRFTAVLALAKLETGVDGLDSFRAAHTAAYAERPADDPWMLLARMASGYKAMALDDARRELGRLLDSCPDAGLALHAQREFPDGAFCRVSVEPGSTDELMIALSEATPLLQEGIDAPRNASLAVWVANDERVRDAAEEADRQGGLDGVRPGVEGSN